MRCRWPRNSRACRVGLRVAGREPLHPPVHGDVVDFDPTLGQEVLDIAVGKPESQKPAHAKTMISGGNRNPTNAELGTARDHPATLTAHRADAPMQQTCGDRPERPYTDDDLAEVARILSEELDGYSGARDAIAARTCVMENRRGW
jgi:hypothetical protein